MSGSLLVVQRLKREQIRKYPNILVVFGDNVTGRGFGGQAKECRGEPNAVGIPTKWFPTRANQAYFSDDDYDKIEPIYAEKFLFLERKLREGSIVAWPKDGLGTGLARLGEKAPKIWFLIDRGFQGLVENAAWVAKAYDLEAASRLVARRWEMPNGI